VLNPSCPCGLKSIPVPLGGLDGAYQVLIHEPDAEIVAQYHWTAKRSKRSIYAYRKWHAAGAEGGQFMHCLLMGRQGIDHRNGDGLDNRRCNLRPATDGQNGANRGKFTGCSSQFKGVSWDKANGRWVAQIRVNGKRHLLGYFQSEIPAASAYDDAAVRYHGEFARTNVMLGLL